MSETGLIYKKIPDIMSEIDAIGKDRKNPKQGYNFRGIDDFYNSIHAVLAKHRVFSVPEVIEEKSIERTSKAGGLLVHRLFTFQYTFYAEDGSFVKATVPGEGMDSGDKACYKAMSGAQKYAFIQIFTVPTADMKDPENDSHDVEPTPAPQPQHTIEEVYVKAIDGIDALLKEEKVADVYAKDLTSKLDAAKTAKDYGLVVSLYKSVVALYKNGKPGELDIF